MITDLIDVAAATPDLMAQQKTDLQTCHKSSQDLVHEAIARCAILYFCCQGKDASSEMKEWLATEINAHNNQIDAHNDRIDQRKKLAEDYRDNKLSESHWLRLPYNSAEKQAEQQAEIEKLTHEGQQRAEYWDNQKKVCAEIARADASKHIPLIRYAYNYDKASDSPTVSGIAHVIDYLIENVQTPAAVSVEKLCQLIDEAGGKHAIIDKQRGNSMQKKPKQVDNSARLVKAYRNKLVEAAQNTKSKATVSMSVDHGDSLFLALGRSNGGQTDILSTFPINDENLAIFAPVLDQDLKIGKAKEVDFLARLLPFKDVIPEGKQSHYKVDGTKSSKKYYKETCVLVLSINGHRAQCLQLTSQYAIASPIVKATLKHELSFGTPDQPQFLKGDSLKQIAETLGSPMDRAFLTITTSGTNVTDIEWNITKSLDSTVVSDDEVQNFAWKPVSSLETPKPLDIDRFNPNVSVDLSYAAIKELYSNRLVAWKGKGKKDGHTDDVTLRFQGNEMVYKYPGIESYTIKLATPIDGVESLNLRGYDLEKTFALLLGTKAETFNLALDTNGLLCLAWDDEYASYAVYLPSADGDGLNARCLTQMRTAKSH
jgi:hypothetical protein